MVTAVAVPQIDELYQAVFVCTVEITVTSCSKIDWAHLRQIYASGPSIENWGHRNSYLCLVAGVFDSSPPLTNELAG